LHGEFEDFTVEWYKKVGTTLCVTLFINISSPYGASLLKYLIAIARRCRDRSYELNLKKFEDSEDD